jgi:hypothetical protein
MSVVATERPLALPAADPALRGLRLLPAPDCEPPYDDERPGGQPLPLRPASMRLAPPLRLVSDADESTWDRDSTPSADLPPLRPFAHALVQRLLEVLAGVRPLAQLQRDTTFEVYDGLERLLTSRPRPTGARPDRRSIRSVHVQEQPGCVAEVTATVRHGQRYAAIAARIEADRDRWQCTELIVP